MCRHYNRDAKKVNEFCLCSFPEAQLCIKQNLTRRDVFASILGCLQKHCKGTKR